MLAEVSVSPRAQEKKMKRSGQKKWTMGRDCKPQRELSMMGEQHLRQQALQMFCVLRIVPDRGGPVISKMEWSNYSATLVVWGLPHKFKIMNIKVWHLKTGQYPSKPVCVKPACGCGDIRRCHSHLWGSLYYKGYQNEIILVSSEIYQLLAKNDNIFILLAFWEGVWQKIKTFHRKHPFSMKMIHEFSLPPPPDTHIHNYNKSKINLIENFWPVLI